MRADDGEDCNDSGGGGDGGSSVVSAINDCVDVDNGGKHAKYNYNKMLL